MSYEELEKEFINAHNIIEAIRNGEIDAVIRNKGAAFLRLEEKMRQTEHALKLSKLHLEGVVSAAPVMIFTLDFKGIITFASGKILDRMCIKSSEIIGRHINEVPELGITDKNYERVLAGESFIDNIKLRDFTFDIHYSPLIDKDDEVKAIIGILVDITERIKAEDALNSYVNNLEDIVDKRTEELLDAREKLLKKEKLALLGQMAGGLGYEIKNPLGVISNAVYFLKMKLFDSDEITKEYLETITSEVFRVNKIITDLRSVFSSGLSSKKEKVPVCELFSEALKRNSIPENIRVKTSISPEFLSVFIDRVQIIQVLDNLVINACQAMSDGGELILESSEDKEGIKISVIDTGCGISEENQKKIFDPLFTTKSRGMGLGLLICKNFVEANVGKLEVNSSEGKGSNFTLVF